jgi:hypothetical protein
MINCLSGVGEWNAGDSRPCATGNVDLLGRDVYIPGSFAPDPGVGGRPPLGFSKLRKKPFWGGRVCRG